MTNIDLKRLENEQDVKGGKLYFTLLLEGNITIENDKGYFDVPEKSFFFSQSPYRVITASPYINGYHIIIKSEAKTALAKTSFKIQNNFSEFQLSVLQKTAIKSTLLEDLIKNNNKDLIESTVILILNQITEESTFLTQPNKTIFEQFEMLITENLDKNYCAGKYAEILNITIKTLIKEVKIGTDNKLTPCKVITHKVVDHAKLLLSTTKHSSKTIAYLLGFSDPYYFIKYFKKNTSYTPTQYRKLKNYS